MNLLSASGELHPQSTTKAVCTNRPNDPRSTE